MIDDELRSRLRDYIAQQVTLGFDDSDEIVEYAVDNFAEEADEEDLSPLVEHVAREEIERHATEAAAWPPVTDCDRLDAAFGELDAAGIVARQYFTCCNNCGMAEIGDEIPEDQAGSVRGFAFYHEQDAERAVESGKLYVSYGAFCKKGEAKADPDVTAVVGGEVVAVLRRQGLTVQWDGDVGTRITVPLVWRRRREDSVVGPA